MKDGRGSMVVVGCSTVEGGQKNGRTVGQDCRTIYLKIVGYPYSELWGVGVLLERGNCTIIDINKIYSPNMLYHDRMRDLIQL